MDSNVISELRKKPHNQDPKVRAWSQTYPGMEGFSGSSLFAMRQFYAFFSPQFEVVPQPVGQMSWGHVRTLLAKVKSVELVLLYAQACSEHGWRR